MTIFDLGHLLFFEIPQVLACRDFIDRILFIWTTCLQITKASLLAGVGFALAMYCSLDAASMISQAELVLGTRRYA